MNDQNGLAEMNSHQPLQLIRVELDQDQAILTACRRTSTSAADGGNRSCREVDPGLCQKSRRRNGDNPPRTS